MLVVIQIRILGAVISGIRRHSSSRDLTRITEINRLIPHVRGIWLGRLMTELGVEARLLYRISRWMVSSGKRLSRGYAEGSYTSDLR